MALQIYSITPIGHQVARTTNPPAETEARKRYRVLYWLDKKGRDTSDSISMNTGISKGELGGILRRLRNAKVIQEDTAVDVAS